MFQIVQRFLERGPILKIPWAVTMTKIESEPWIIRRTFGRFPKDPFEHRMIATFYRVVKERVESMGILVIQVRPVRHQKLHNFWPGGHQDRCLPRLVIPRVDVATHIQHEAQQS